MVRPYFKISVVSQTSNLSFLYSLYCPIGYGEGDRAMREDRDEREAYRRGGAECKWALYRVTIYCNIYSTADND